MQPDVLIGADKHLSEDKMIDRQHPFPNSFRLQLVQNFPYLLARGRSGISRLETDFLYFFDLPHWAQEPLRAVYKGKSTET